jgi:hypothetical protein
VLTFHPEENGAALCSYMLRGDVDRKGLEALEPSCVLWGSRNTLSRLYQYRALQLFYRGDYDGVIAVVEGRAQ